MPGVRGEHSEGYDEVKRILDGEVKPVRMPFEAGTLSIFAGHYTLHRVTPVRGHRHRLVAVLCYNREPGIANSDAVRKLFGGARPESSLTRSSGPSILFPERRPPCRDSDHPATGPPAPSAPIPHRSPSHSLVPANPWLYQIARRRLPAGTKALARSLEVTHDRYRHPAQAGQLLHPPLGEHRKARCERAHDYQSLRGNLRLRQRGQSAHRRPGGHVVRQRGARASRDRRRDGQASPRDALFLALVGRKRFPPARSRRSSPNSPRET